MANSRFLFYSMKRGANESFVQRELNGCSLMDKCGVAWTDKDSRIETEKPVRQYLG